MGSPPGQPTGEVGAPPSEFDAYADDYEGALSQGLRYSGEDSAYFARGRIERLGRRLEELGFQPRRIMDFGCGTGSSAPLLLALPGAQRVIGVDESAGLVKVAREDHGSPQIEFLRTGEPVGEPVDLIYVNGVFHHIEPPQRGETVAELARALRPGGLLALCENNPLNPGTRLVMRRIPFDRDAKPLTAGSSRRLLRRAEFEILGVDFLFFFPHALRALRRAEPVLARLPLGAQYMVLARRRDGAAATD